MTKWKKSEMRIMVLSSDLRRLTYAMDEYLKAVSKGYEKIDPHFTEMDLFQWRKGTEIYHLMPVSPKLRESFIDKAEADENADWPLSQRRQENAQFNNLQCRRL